MAENIERWWARRQHSKNAPVPYPIGTFRSDWQQFPVLVRQFHPDLNAGITLTQIPPAADVYVLWECDAGHRFVATPTEQRERPGRTRRRSSWCPECTLTARRPGGTPRRGAAPQPPALLETARPTESALPPPRLRRVPSAAAGAAAAPAARGRLMPGEAFRSNIAPRPASVAEADLRRRLSARLDLDLECNAVWVRRRFHDRLEVWPDIVIADLKVAIEYDTTGRTGTEHVGEREKSDRQKDRLLRQVGWEVIRIRCSKLAPLGPWDVSAAGVSTALIDRVLDQLRNIRGHLIVDAYCRREDPAELGPDAPAQDHR